MSGRFITFEGVEGCGKTTQIARLERYLEGQGYSVFVTREPGGTPLAEAIRELLLDVAHGTMAPTTELLLYEAARAQHVAERIRPALAAGQVVLCDRFADSTTAYQGAGRGLHEETVVSLHHVATGGIWPDCTLLLDLAAAEGLERVRRRGGSDRIQEETLAFHERVRQGFLCLAAREPQRIRIIDAAQSIEEVAQTICSHIRTVLAPENA